MFPGFHFVEESLKHFMIEEQSSGPGSSPALLYKYNNLKVYMDPKRCATPHIIIRIGIAEVMYDINSWIKISGGLGTDEGYIRKWIDRHMGILDFSVTWRDANRPKVVTMQESEYDD